MLALAPSLSCGSVTWITCGFWLTWIFVVWDFGLLVSWICGYLAELAFGFFVFWLCWLSALSVLALLVLALLVLAQLVLAQLVFGSVGSWLYRFC